MVARVQVELPQVVVVMAMLDAKLVVVVIEIAVVLEGWVRRVELTATSIIIVCVNAEFIQTNAPFQDSRFFIHTCSLAVRQLFLVPPSTCPETAPHPKTSSSLCYVDLHVYIDISKPQLLADTYCFHLCSVIFPVIR